MAMRSPTPMPSAPPLPPSPMTTQTIGVRSRLISSRLHGDGLGHAALLGADARIRARRVDERHDGQVELLGQLHRPQGLAVAFRVGAAEVAGDLFLGVAALVLADRA